jgi:tRNA-dihydrouridine synthase B
MTAKQQWRILKPHLQGIHDLYGETMGFRIARKHVMPYLAKDQQKRQQFNQLTTAAAQLDFLCSFFNTQQPTV